MAGVGNLSKCTVTLAHVASAPVTTGGGGCVPHVTEGPNVLCLDPLSVHVMSMCTTAVWPVNFDVTPEMSTVAVCDLLTWNVCTIGGAKPSWTLIVTGIGALGNESKCTVTSAHVASTEVTTFAA